MQSGTQSPPTGWGEVLRRAGIALHGRMVGVWEVADDGVVPLAASFDQRISSNATQQVSVALRDFGIPLASGRRWVGCQLTDSQRWCLAPVRRETPEPPPGGVERRGRERMTLELTGLCLGLTDPVVRTSAPPANDLLRQGQARLDLLTRQVPAVIWTTDTDMRVTSASGAGFAASGESVESMVGQSLLAAFGTDPGIIDAVSAHQRALAGEPAVCRVAPSGRPLDLRLEPYREPDGRISGVVGIALDVSEQERAWEAAWRHESDLENFFDYAALALHWLSPEGVILRANSAELDLLGYDREQYVGRHMASVHADRSTADEIMARLARGEPIRGFPARLRHRDDSVKHVLVYSAGFVERGPLRYARCYSRDVTSLAEADESRRRLVAIVEGTDDAVIGETLDGIITSWNGGAERTFGYTESEVIGQPVTMLAPAERKDEKALLLARVRRGERIERVETERLRKDGGRITVSLTVTPIRDQSGLMVGVATIARDVTERKLVEAHLRHDAMHDHLTRLPNRPHFIQRVAQALDRLRRNPDRRFAVLFLDFDHFKVINDSLGHIVGDRLLARIALRLESTTRPGDLVARLGGDEFTLLLEGVDEVGDAERVADRIKRDFQAPFIVDGHEVFVSASIGITLSATGYQNPEDVLRDADIAMYRAKALGRSRYEVFAPELRARLQSRLRMDTDLRRAVERNEFHLLFQPIVEIGSRRLDGFEALIRWNHPERGEVMPLEFIPLAEETGLIIPIGRWVMREACRQVRQWQLTFPDLRPINLNINLSTKQLLHPNLVEEVATILRETELNPRSLRLEITESALVEQIELSGAVLRDLRSLELELHLDDFGTGYSSLSYLPRFPLSTLKIDRSFIRRMGTRKTDLEVVRTIVGLAQNLGLAVIAEGVETAAQCERLVTLGCSLAQGFHFASPLEPVVVEELLRRGGGVLSEADSEYTGRRSGD